MSEGKKSPSREAYDNIVGSEPFYGLCRIRGVGELRDRETHSIGPDLILGVQIAVATAWLRPGTYAVRRRIQATKTLLPDWGTLIVRGPGSWTLRRRDGRRTIVPAGDGVCDLRGGA